MDSLGQVLLLPEDVHFWDEIRDKDIVLNLKWHTIAVSILLRHPSLFIYFLI